MLELKNVTIQIKDKSIIQNINLKIIPNEITAIIGPNGSGKSTLLKVIANHLKTTHGEILLLNKNINKFSRRELANYISYLTQSPQIPEEITVLELVNLGRYRYFSMFDYNRINDPHVETAINNVGLSDLKHVVISKLSGGQRQRAFIAMALTQNSQAILLDEPTNFLDLKHQLELLQLITQLRDNHDKTIIIVLHDLAQAIKYSDNLIIMQHGKIIHNNKTKNLDDLNIIKNTFGIKMNVHILADGQQLIEFDL